MPRHADPHRRADILAAARAAFLDDGYAAVRVTDIAARAGIAAGTLYLSFASKEAIALALVDDVVARMGAHLAPSLARFDTPDGIAAVVHEALAFAATEHRIMRLLPADILLSKTAASPFSPARRGLHDALSQTLAAGMRRGTLRPYDPDVLAETLIGLVNWAIEACFQRGAGDPARYEPTVAHFIQLALLPSQQEVRYNPTKAWRGGECDKNGAMGHAIDSRVRSTRRGEQDLWTRPPYSAPRRSVPTRGGSARATAASTARNNGATAVRPAATPSARRRGRRTTGGTRRRG